MNPLADSVIAWQQDFYPQWHARYQHLPNRDVRALAWLLQAPDLLDNAAAQWQQRIANVHALVPEQDISAFLASMAQDPSLTLAMQASPQSRIGRYAEKLLAFFFERSGVLHAQGLQVRQAMPLDEQGQAAKGNQTIGEFDFLLRASQPGLLHWELATKFYLFAPDLPSRAASDYFIGPNLADSLGAKMQKILHQQLALSQHAKLEQPVIAAQAYIKGWMFYPYQPRNISILAQQAGLNAQHCRGFWCYASDIFALAEQLQAPHPSILSRLACLAPAAFAQGEQPVLSIVDTHSEIVASFTSQNMPILLALLRWEEGQWRECGRSFVVPDDWSERAALARIPQSVSGD